MPVAVLSRFRNTTAGLVKSIRQVLSRKETTSDRVDLNLWGLNLSVKRDTTLDTPAELSVIIPRVEFRYKYNASPAPSAETEIIFSSITVVLSPRHPSEQDATPPLPVPTPTTLNFIKR